MKFYEFDNFFIKRPLGLLTENSQQLRIPNVPDGK